MKTITKKLRGLVFYLTFLAALALCGRVETYADTLTMTIERFTLGGGFIMEPEIVTFEHGTKYDTIVKDVLKRKNLKYSSSVDEMGFYLEGIDGVDVTWGTSRIPACVLGIFEMRNNEMPDANFEGNLLHPGGLYEFCYTEGAGWMYYVNNKWQNGMSIVTAQDGDVMRLMFSFNGGMDLTGRNVDNNTGSAGDTEYYYVADKTELIRKMGQMNANRGSWTAGMQAAYDNAVSVMAKMNATDMDVLEAINMLNDGGTSPESGLSSITLNKTTMSMKTGDISNLAYTLSPLSVTSTVTWTSSDTNVASVEGLTNGARVTAKAKGTATITATAVSGGQTKTASCTVTVTDDGAASDADFEKGAPKVSVTKKSASSVSISWAAYPGAESYNILRRKSGESFKEIKKGVTGTSYTDSTVKANTTYYYSVEAVKGSQKSKTDTNCMVKTPKAGSEKPAEVKAPAKTTLKSVTAKKKQAVLKWKKPARAEGYEVCRAIKKNGSYAVVKTIKKAGTLTYTDKKLKSKKTYYYKVRAYRTVNGKKSYGAYSGIVKVTAK